METQLHRTTILRGPPPNLVTLGYTETTEETQRKRRERRKEIPKNFFRGSPSLHRVLRVTKSLTQRPQRRHEGKGGKIEIIERLRF
jgi:hypothetical protein